MQPAPIPDNEAERMQALRRYDMLDSEVEQDFDDLVQLASYICEAPIAVITLIDTDRQWFKAKIGLDVEETSRAISLCAHAINQTDVFVVPDTRQDERFHDNPLVTGAPYIHFYAGSPLITHDGHAIGSLCVIDNQPRELNTQQLSALQALSRQVVSQMELRYHMRHLLSANQQLCEDQELLKIANLHKTYFLSNMSHEVRTPLNSILGFTQLLQMDAEEHGFDDTIKRSLDTIQQSGRHLLSTIDNLLQVSKEANTLSASCAEVKLLDLIESLYQVNLFKAREAGLQFTCDNSGKLPKSIITDGARLMQILMSLIDNAIKFTPAGGKVSLQTQQEKNHIVFRIVDNGIGIAENKQQSIFEVFEQVELSTARHYDGSGLGLSIAKQLIELLGGRIEVSSTLHQGSTFTVYLPHATH